MKCSDVQTLSPSWLKGEEDMSNEIEVHLKDCDDCQKFIHYMGEMKKDLLAMPNLEPKAGYLDRLNSKLEFEGETLSNESTTQIRAVLKPRSSRHSSLSRASSYQKLNLLERFVLFFRENWKSPALHYAMVVHVIVIGFAVGFYIQSSQKEDVKQDIVFVRQQAYVNADFQEIQADKINVSVLSTSGQVFLISTGDCVRLQKNKPLSGKFLTIDVEDGLIQLSSEDLNKYFGSSKQIAVLRYSNAIEVWSKPAIERYISENTTITIN